MTAGHLFAAATLALCASVAAARTAADFFVDAPTDIMPLLKQTTRLDMIDYFSSGLPNASANAFDGRSRITAMSDSALTVQLSRDATWQIALVPQKSDTLIAVIETVLTPVPDSGIAFYRTDWSPAKGAPMPSAADFIAPAHAREAKSADMPDFFFLKAEYTPAAGGTLVFTNTTPQYYKGGDAPSGLSLMADSIATRLVKNRFRSLSKQ